MTPGSYVVVGHNTNIEQCLVGCASVRGITPEDRCHDLGVKQLALIAAMFLAASLSSSAWSKSEFTLYGLRVGSAHTAQPLNASAAFRGDLVDLHSRSRCPGGVVRTLLSSGRAVRGIATIRGGRVRCLWRLPAGVSGKYFRGAVVVLRPGGGSWKLSFWRHIE